MDASIVEEIEGIALYNGHTIIIGLLRYFTLRHSGLYERVVAHNCNAILCAVFQQMCDLCLKGQVSHFMLDSYFAVDPLGKE